MIYNSIIFLSIISFVQFKTYKLGLLRCNNLCQQLTSNLSVCINWTCTYKWDFKRISVRSSHKTVRSISVKLHGCYYTLLFWSSLVTVCFHCMVQISVLHKESQTGLERQVWNFLFSFGWTIHLMQFSFKVAFSPFCIDFLRAWRIEMMLNKGTEHVNSSGLSRRDL